MELTGILVGIEVRWVDRAQLWTLSMSDSNGALLVGPKALVGGADLLKQRRYDEAIPQGALVVVDTTKQDSDPTFASLGRSHWVIYLDDE